MNKEIDWNKIKKNIREEISEEIYSIKKGFDGLKPSTKITYELYLEVLKEFSL